MNKGRHTTTCNIVVEAKKTDRFFMDMRVYEVMPYSLDVSSRGARSIMWRGIYLAIELAPSVQPREPHL